MKIPMSRYFKPQVTSSCTETCRLLKIIELLMFNYRRADQLDLWKENTPYVFVRLIKQLNCSLNIIRTNNCRKSNCMHHLSSTLVLILKYQKQIHLPVFHHKYQNQTAIKKKETNRSQSQFFCL